MRLRTHAKPDAAPGGWLFFPIQCKLDSIIHLTLREMFRMARFLGPLLLAVLATPVFADQPRVPPLSNDAVWKLLPREQPPLPGWALALADSMPKTVARQLELDAVHRAKNPLDPILRAKMRWVAADANRCEYSKRYAEADLRRAGVPQSGVDALANGGVSFDKDWPAYAFARKLTLAAYSVTDEEMAELLALYGPAKLTAMVHTLAHANFQDRIFLALGLTVEPNGPYPPLTQLFDPNPTTPAPPRPEWKQVEIPNAPEPKMRWSDKSLTQLHKELATQKARKPRIPVPGPEVIAKLPGAARPQASRVVWTTVSMGYQPMMTKAWFDTMATFQSEAKFDRVFSNSYFWVITRTNDCFY